MVREAIKVKKEAFRDWKDWRTPNSAERDRRAKNAAVAEVGEANSRTWEQSGEAMEKDFPFASWTWNNGPAFPPHADG